MHRGLLAGFLLFAACQSDLSLLEGEMIVFKAQNERVRVEALEADYERDRKRADELNAEVLLLAQERDALYDRYDKLSTEVAGLRAQIGKLEAQLAAEQKELDRLTRELTDLKAKRRALDGAKAPE